MSFLKDRDVEFAYTGITEYSNCGGLLQETGLYYEKDNDPSSPTYDQWVLQQAVYNDKLILTDGVSGVAPGQPQVIYLDDCSTSQITFPCNEPVGLSIDGKSVDIVNVCDMPITITGLVNSDPVRFTVFDSSHEGKEVYDTGNAPDFLPATIAPYTRLRIPTLFHPSRNEIEDGQEGSWENRTGDAWHSKISLFPGFPIVSCETDNCDTNFIISGELVCDKLDRVPLLNYNNFEGYYSCEDDNALGELEFQNCLLSSGIFSDITNHTYDMYSAMQGLAGEIESKYCKNNPSFAALAITFKDALYKSEEIYDFLETYHISIIDFQGAKITGRYYKKHERVYFDGIEFTGLHYEISTEDPSVLVSNMTAFMNTSAIGTDAREHNVFFAEQGDFVNEGFCFSNGYVELDAAPYTALEDIALSCNKIAENEPAGTIIGVFGSTQEELTKYAGSDYNCAPSPVSPTANVVAPSPAPTPAPAPTPTIDETKQPGNGVFTYDYHRFGEINSAGTFQDNGSMGWGSLGDGDGGIWRRNGKDLLLWHPFLFGGNPLLCGCDTSVTSPINFKNDPLIGGYSNGAKGCLNVCYNYFDEDIIAAMDYVAAVNHTKLFVINNDGKWAGCGGAMENNQFLPGALKEKSPGTVPWIYRSLGIM